MYTNSEHFDLPHTNLVRITSLIESFKRYDIGTRENQLIRLTDVRDKKVVNKVRADLKKHAETNPDRKVLIFFGFAGHGMQVDGE